MFTFATSHQRPGWLYLWAFLGLLGYTALLTAVAEARVVRDSGIATSSTVVMSEAVISRTVREPTQLRTTAVVVHETIAPDQPPEVTEPEIITYQQITLAELGLLQLAAHDLFNVDRDTGIDSENGKLDLSTLLEHGRDNIAIGGEPRNRENIIIFSVAKEYGELYERYIEQGYTHNEAYVKLLKKYHKELEAVYETVFGEDFPKPHTGAVTMTENLALRTIHDFLPGHIMFKGTEVLTVDHALLGQSLTQTELRALTAPLDGHFDEEFLDVVILIPPDTIMHISLLERDSSFAAQFGAEHTFEHFMAELEDGSYDSGEDVMHYIRTLFGKGMYFE